MRHLDRLDRLPDWGRNALAVFRNRAGRPGATIPPRRIGEILAAPRDQPAHRYAGAIAFFGDRDKEMGYGEAMRGQLARSALDLLAPYFAASDSVLGGANWAIFTPICPTT